MTDKEKVERLYDLSDEMFLVAAEYENFIYTLLKELRGGCGTAYSVDDVVEQFPETLKAMNTILWELEQLEQLEH